LTGGALLIAGEDGGDQGLDAAAGLVGEEAAARVVR
jgi:hypothetical protein